MSGWFLVCCFGLFAAGSVFQDALNGDGLFGLPPAPSAIIAIIAAIGWASWAWDAAGN